MYLYLYMQKNEERISTILYVSFKKKKKLYVVKYTIKL